ncbi:phage tail protein [Seohaeicola saemankumensis]|nr:phage tail protein [Seohaeicola saemankumensis]MCA0871386.1 phage tail protein [Seohaeicola saemankumensis]
MGSRSSSTQTVGYRYALGAHLALCHGPVDAIREIRVDDRTAWSILDGTEPEVVSGVGATQTLGTFGSVIAFPADEFGSTAQVTIYGSNGIAGISIGQVLDLALQTDAVTHRITVRGIAHDEREHLTWMQVEPKTLYFSAQPVTITTVASGGSTDTSGDPPVGARIRIDKPDLFGGESREGGIVGVIDVLMGTPDQGQNDYLAARAGADVPGFRGLCSLVLRQVYLGLNPYLKPWAVRLTRVLTAEDGAVQWYPETAEILPADPDPETDWGPDMNPAHIIRECLTNRTWGLGYGDTDIGPSFTGAADQLHTEGFGLSLLWQSDASLEEFLADILHHIDAQLYVDRRTGRWEVKLIRDDYDPEALLVFDETNVVDWGELGRREAVDLVNSVTVTFSDVRTDQPGSVSVTDTARVQLMGQVISTTVDYPGVRLEELAVRLAERDLRGLSAPLLSGEITVNRQGADLDPGSTIRLVNPRRGLEGTVMRVVEIDHGDGRDNGIRLRIVEDAFALGDTALVGGDTTTGYTSFITSPVPLDRRMVQEAPYWLLVQELGHTQANAELQADPDAGAIMAAGERPSSDALTTQVWIDTGTGYTDDDPTGFVPTAILDADVTDDPEDTMFAVRDWTGLSELLTGTLAAIGEEVVRIDGISATEITVGRGCLDTVPVPHAAGTPVICWQSAARPTRGSFLAGETVSVKLLPQTGLGTLPLAQAPTDMVTFGSRAIRPLPPGNLRGDGLFLPTLASPETTLTWAHRDRLSQTSAVFDSYVTGDIGPEPGVTYEVRIHWVDPDTEDTLEPAAVVIDAGQATSWTLTDADYPEPPIGVELAAIRVRAVRDGYEDRAFREFRVSVGGKVQVTGQELTLVFTGPGIDVTEQMLILSCTGPGIDLAEQAIILDLRPPETGIILQELIAELTV